MDSLFQIEDSGNERIFVGFFVLMIFLLIPNVALAGQLQDITGNIHIGRLKIHPTFSVKEEYTDNIFHEANKEKGSSIVRLSPGIAFQFPYQRHFLQLGYHAEIIRADRFSKEFNIEHHLANALLNLDFNKLNLLFADNWARLSTRPDHKDDIRNQYYQNLFSVEASYKLADRYKVTAFYKNFLREFGSYHLPGQDNPEYDNYNQNETGFTIYYRFLPLTSALIEYAFTNRNNKDMELPSTDSESNRIWLGLTWEATAKITGTIKGGYVTRDYDGLSDDWDGFGMEANVKYDFSRYTTFSFTGFRKVLETSVTVQQAGREGEYGTYYISTGGTFSITHRLSDKFSVHTEATYYKDDYQERGLVGKERDDDRFGCGVGLDYKVWDWLSCYVNYHYNVNDSNVEVEDYRENLVTGGVSFKF
jgi:hypothetical protein